MRLRIRSVPTCPEPPTTANDGIQRREARRGGAGRRHHRGTGRTERVVVTPEPFGPCCAGTKPVAIPGGCRWCDSKLCRVNESDDLPERDYYVESRYADMGDAWVPARCVDDRLRASTSDGAERCKAERHVLLGVIGP